MKRSTYPLILCPTCRGALTLSGETVGDIRTGVLTCPTCHKTYLSVDLVPCVFVGF
jgi:uncharacterized protein YbaR (Trm112 family)